MATLTASNNYPPLSIRRGMFLNYVHKMDIYSGRNKMVHSIPARTEKFIPAGIKLAIPFRLQWNGPIHSSRNGHIHSIPANMKLSIPFLHGMVHSILTGMERSIPFWAELNSPFHLSQNGIGSFIPPGVSWSILASGKDPFILARVYGPFQSWQSISNARCVSEWVSECVALFYPGPEKSW